MSIRRMELITNSIVTIGSIWHNSAADFFAFWKISAANLANLVAPPIDGTISFSALKSTSGPVTDGVNGVQIHA